LTISAIALVAQPAIATDQQQTGPAGVSEELELLKEETVSIAMRHEQPISEAPSNVYVITDEDIRQSGAVDLPTVLRRIPGMEVMQTTGAEFNVSVRGDNQLNANKLLVMVDGRSIYIDVQGTVLWKLLPVTLPEIKRIEVLKGPASAVYGFNAFDGIINIITKSPEEMKGTTLQFGGGEFNTITSAAIQAGTVGKLGYRLSVGHDQNASGGTETRSHSAQTNLMSRPSMPCQVNQR
jgi:iron complex outermembrane receptor protein